MRVCGHTMEVDLSTNSRNHCAKNIQQQVMTAVIADKDQLHRRRIRAPITLQNMQARKISLFETINKDWLLSLRGTCFQKCANGLLLRRRKLMKH